MPGGCVQSSNCKDRPGNPSASEQWRQATLGTMTNLQTPARGRTARREYRSIICVDSDLSRIRTDSPGRGTKPGQSKGSDSLKKGCWRRPMTRGSFRSEDDVARAHTSPTDKDCLPIFILTLRVTEVVEPLKLPYSQNETLSHLNAGGTSDGEEVRRCLWPPHCQGHTTFKSLSLQNVPFLAPGDSALDNPTRVLIMGVARGFPRAPSSPLNNRES